MSLFNSLGSKQQQQPMNMQDMRRQLQTNTAAILKQANLNVPDGMTDPQQIVSYLFQSGQIMPRTLRRR